MPVQVCLLRHFPPHPLPQLPLPSLCASTAEPGTPRPSACLCPAQPLLCCPVHPAGSTSLSPSLQPLLPGLRTEQEQGAAPAELQNPAITQLFFFFFLLQAELFKCNWQNSCIVMSQGAAVSSQGRGGVGVL